MSHHKHHPMLQPPMSSSRQSTASSDLRSVIDKWVPGKSSTKTNEITWINSNNSVSLAQLKRNKNIILHMLSALCHNDASKASDLLMMIVPDNNAMKEKVIGSNVDMNVKK